MAPAPRPPPAPPREGAEPAPQAPSVAATYTPIARKTGPVSPHHLAGAVRREALQLGFARVGFAPADEFHQAADALRRWLAQGEHGGLSYLEAPRRDQPRSLLPEAATLVVVAMMAPLSPAGDERRLPLAGRVARYAQGADYHGVIKTKLQRLAHACAEAAGREITARACVDTAPLLEREAARRAGVGFSAKSTMCITPGLGSQTLLGVLLIDLWLPPTPLERQGCGRCTACLDACPTGAFAAPHRLDARRCISYLTIESREPIPAELRAGVGDWVFGCDVCQDVCPYNQTRKAPEPPAEVARPGSAPRLDLVSLLELSASGYRRLVRGSALSRASRPQLQRNAAVALGNGGSPRSVEPLGRALLSSRYPLVRGHSAWALGRIGGPRARQLLLEAAAQPQEDWVIEEIRSAISSID